MVLTLEPDLEAALTEQARNLGIAPEVLAPHQLRLRFLPQSLVDEPRDEWERQLRRSASIAVYRCPMKRSAVKESTINGLPG